LLNYPAKPKDSYYDVACSLKDKLASARVKRFTWDANEYFEAELFLLNDAPDGIPAGTLTVYLRINAETRKAFAWEHGAVGPNQNLKGPTVRFLLPDAPSGMLRLELKASSAELNNEYRLLYYGADAVRLRTERSVIDSMDSGAVARFPRLGMSGITEIDLKNK
jgi:hypothetical protein